jgi:anaerobic selenocysteine-containing dehydrogenase
MNAVDAGLRSIADGDDLRVYNLSGGLRLLARVNNSLPPGVVAAYLDWARTAPGGENINVLTSDRLTDMVGGATFTRPSSRLRSSEPALDLPRQDSGSRRYQSGLWRSEHMTLYN